MRKLYLKIALGGTLIHLLSAGYASMNPDEGDRIAIKRELNNPSDLSASKRARIDSTSLTTQTEEGQTPQILVTLTNTPLLTGSTTHEQDQSLSSEEEIQRSLHLVFSGEPLYHVASFLGREEVGQLQRVNKGIKDFFQGQESFGLWKSYARQLQLEIADDINFNELRSKIREYYTPHIKLWMAKNDLRAISIVISDFKANNGSTKVGHTIDKKNNGKETATIYENGEIKFLGLLNNGYSSRATSISADKKIVGGLAGDSFNREDRAVIWNEQGIVSLQDYNFKEPHDILCNVWSMSSDGSDFVVMSRNDIYKAHVPRHDLWKMK